MVPRRASDDHMKQHRTCGMRPPPAGLQEVPAVGFQQLTRRQEGQTMAEYAVVIGVITPVLVLMLALMADAIVARLQTVDGFLT